LADRDRHERADPPPQPVSLGAVAALFAAHPPRLGEAPWHSPASANRLKRHRVVQIASAHCGFTATRVRYLEEAMISCVRADAG
jgi:hypothetical protein